MVPEQPLTPGPSGGPAVDAGAVDLAPAPSSEVAVVGAGYVGLTTAVVLAHLGHRVTCGEIDADKVGQLNAGRPTILEEGLDTLLAGALASGRLRFVLGAASAVVGAEFVFLCLPTPERPDGSADVSALQAAALDMAPHLPPGAVVVNKSTVPVGSASLIERLIRRPDVAVVSNPEFLREGTAVQDSLHPDRVVVGSDNTDAARRVGSLFASLGAPVIVTDAATSETIKYAANAFLATKLSFVNAVATLCEHLGANIGDVLRGLGADHRIGFHYLQPGPGWGGSCLPKDTRALLYMAQRSGYAFPLLREVIDTNADQLQRVVDKVRLVVGGDLCGAVVGTWGLTFKGGTDDCRRSPAIDVICRLVDEGAVVRAHDPAISAVPPEVGPHVELVADPVAVGRGADVLVVLTDWEVFRKVELVRLRAEMRSPQIVDARNLLDPVPVRELGFQYVGLGNP